MRRRLHRHRWKHEDYTGHYTLRGHDSPWFSIAIEREGCRCGDKRWNLVRW